MESILFEDESVSLKSLKNKFVPYYVLLAETYTLTHPYSVMKNSYTLDIEKFK